MADLVQINGSGQQGKLRNPLGVIGLSLITLGIYGIVWYYKTNRELAEIGRVHGTDECGTSPGTSVLAVTLGAFVIVPAFVSAFKFCKRIQAAERLSGAQPGVDPGLLFVLYVFVAPVAHYLAQSSLNKILQAQAGLPQTNELTGAPVPVAAPAAAPAE